MPTINAVIKRAWRHDGEAGRIHYAITRPDGSDRRLYADEGHALYVILAEWLQSIGYTSPQSGQE